MEEESLEIRKEELSKKYNIDFDKLEKEQIKLAKDLKIKDKIDFSLVNKFGAFENIFIKNKILSCLVVLDNNFDIIDQCYVIEKIHFPYFPGFRSYRELPSMIKALEKINGRLDVVFISGQGIIHPRLGLASHFGLSTGIPAIGVSDFIKDCEFKEEDNSEIKKNPKNDVLLHFKKYGDSRHNKIVGKVLIAKKKSNSLYISPGNNISVESAYNLSKRLIVHPHKRPEPIHIASKYAKSVKKELEFKSNP